MKSKVRTFESLERRIVLTGSAVVELGDFLVPVDEVAVQEVAEEMVEHIARFNYRNTAVRTELPFGKVVKEFKARRGEFKNDVDKVAAVIDPGTNTILRAGLNDRGFAASDDLAAGDLERGLEAAAGMNSIMLEAFAATGVAEDGDISAEDLFEINDYIIDNYMVTDDDGNPIWVNDQGELQDRTLNQGGDDNYYVGVWADYHGDDAGGRREYGVTGDNVEHGYHLIQNDGGTTTLDGNAGDYTLNPNGGDGQNLWTTVADGIYHMGFDIVSGENGALEFAYEYEEGVDFYFLNEDGDRNQSLQDVSDWLDFFLAKDLATGSLSVSFALAEDVRFWRHPFCRVR